MKWVMVIGVSFGIGVVVVRQLLVDSWQVIGMSCLLLFFLQLNFCYLMVDVS